MHDLIAAMTGPGIVPPLTPMAFAVTPKFWQQLSNEIAKNHNYYRKEFEGDMLYGAQIYVSTHVDAPSGVIYGTDDYIKQYIQIRAVSFL